jgi:hypothetical protein
MRPGEVELALDFPALRFKARDFRSPRALLVALLHRRRFLTGALVVDDIPTRESDFGRRQAAVGIRAMVGVIVDPRCRQYSLRIFAQSRRNARAWP